MGEELDQAGEVRAEAAEWFARLKTVPVSRETLEDFFEWRRVGTNGAAFDEVERFWSQAGEAGDSPAMRAATDAAYRRGDRRARWYARRAFLWTTAIAALLITVAGALTVFRPDDGTHRYATQVGERSVITLEDGSTVMLDTASALAVRFSAKERHVVLDRGQAYFTVAHRANQPFTVEADGTSVLATGTQFEVRRTSGATEVTLVEGSVKVDGPGDAPSTRLQPGQQARIAGIQAPVVRGIDTATATAWRRGRIVLDGRTLAEAVSEVNRYTNRPIRLKAAQHAGDRLSGSLDAGDVESFVTAATALLPVRAERDEHGAVTLVDPSPAR